MTASATTAKRVCSWDSEPDPALNFWTTGNVEEVIPGVPTPFIASLFQEVDATSGQEMIDRLGISDILSGRPAPVGNWIAVFAGRGALNLAWFAAYLATIQTGDGSGALEQYFSSDRENLQTGAGSDHERAARLRDRAVQSLWPQAVASIEGANRKTTELRLAQQTIDFRKLSDAALWKYLEKLRRVHSHLLATHVIISGAAGEMAADTGKLLARELGPDFNEGMVAGLTTGLGEIESALPGFELWRIGRFVASKPALATRVARMSAAETQAALAKPADASWRAFAKAFAEFIERFGFRGQCEADPTVATWDEDPTFVLSVIKTNASAGPDQDPVARSKKGEQARKALEAQIAAKLSTSARREFFRLCSKAQLYARSRERSKAAFVRASRLFRPGILELARRAAANGVVTTEDDFFYLTYTEAKSVFLEGEQQQMGAKVAERRAERARMESVRPPEVYEAPPPVTAIASASADGNVLHGAGVSVGVATGKARVIASAAAAEEADLEPGEVLIAPFTDAAWTPLFVPAAAVVVETGGMLSHAATVAREYGIPAVVAVHGATTLIRTGQVVTVDGLAGTVSLAD